MKYRRALWLFLYVLGTNFCLASIQAPRTEPFVFLSGFQEHSFIAQFRKKVYSELFRRINTPFEVQYVPSIRASQKVDRGTADGEMTRVYEYQNEHPHQLRIDVPLYKLDIVAYTKESSQPFTFYSWKDLGDPTLFVEYRRGVTASESSLTPFVLSERLSAVSTIEQGFLKLKAGRTDVFVHTSLPAWEYHNKLEFKSHIVESGVLETVTLYPYVNVSKMKLIPLIKKALLEIKDEGLIVQYCIDIYGDAMRTKCESLHVN